MNLEKVIKQQGTVIDVRSHVNLWVENVDSINIALTKSITQGQSKSSKSALNFMLRFGKS
jgi:hypothetical protein